MGMNEYGEQSSEMGKVESTQKREGKGKIMQNAVKTHAAMKICEFFSFVANENGSGVV